MRINDSFIKTIGDIANLLIGISRLVQLQLDHSNSHWLI